MALLAILNRKFFQVKVLILAVSCPIILWASDPVLKNDLAVTAHPLATQAALTIYEKGGNAIDAAIAAAFVLGVVEPHNSGIGGGGFMLIYKADTQQTITLDYREMAPRLAATHRYTKGESDHGYFSIAVPGMPAGMELAFQGHATLPWKELLKPAYNFAGNGISITAGLAEGIDKRQRCLAESTASRRVYFRDGRPLRRGDRLIQKDLAKTIKLLAQEGAPALYRGRLAKHIDRLMKHRDAFVRLSDLKKYKAMERAPLAISYRDWTIHSMPSPSSGGILMKQMFGMIENDPLRQWAWQSPKTAHLLAEVMKLAFADRSQYLGDSDFAPIPNKLTSSEYAHQQRSRIDMNKTTLLEQALNSDQDQHHTTHANFSDRYGNVVAMTHSLNHHFGSCITVPGTGIMMNNHMDDFSIQTRRGPKAAINAFGLLQGKANRVEAYKRPLSSMSPTIVFKKGRPVYALGSPGGPKIITNVFQVLVNLLDHGMGLEEAIAKPKLHHQATPDELLYEKGVGPDILKALRKKGHHIKEKRQWGNIQALHIDWKKETSWGVSDPRGEGSVGIR